MILEHSRKYSGLVMSCEIIFILCVAVEKTQQFCEKKGREIILVPHTQISLVLFFDSQKTVACLQKKKAQLAFVRTYTTHTHTCIVLCSLNYNM